MKQKYSMKITTIAVAVVFSLLLSGCYTCVAVTEMKYWALPAAVPADAVLLPGELFLLCLFGDALSAK